MERAPYVWSLSCRQDRTDRLQELVMAERLADKVCLLPMSPVCLVTNVSRLRPFPALPGAREVEF